MTHAIVWEMPDGSIWITHPADPNADINAIAAQVQAEIPDLVTATRKPDQLVTELPQSRRFRSCWRADGTGQPVVDMPLARTQRLAEIRTERNTRLDASDGLMARANELGGGPEIAAWETYRQALRDLPNNLVFNSVLDGLTTTNELEAYEPTWPLAP